MKSINYNDIIRKDHKKNLLCLSDFLNFYNNIRIGKGLSEKRIDNFFNSKKNRSNKDFIVKLVKEANLVKNIDAFEEDTKLTGLVRALKKHRLYKVTGRGSKRYIYCDRYILAALSIWLDVKIDKSFLSVLNSLDLDDISMDIFINSKKSPSKTKSEYIYILKCVNTYKIGITNDIPQRIKSCQTGNAYEITLLYSRRISSCSAIEKSLHQTFAKKRMQGEWFKLNNKDIDKAISIINNVEV